MDTGTGDKPRRHTYRAGAIVIGLTLAACLAALVLRTPLRSRYWAWQLVRASGIEQRAAPLTLLCNAGDDARWGTEVLLRHSDSEIRQFGVLVLQHVRSDWSRRRLLQLLEDPSQTVREMAALGLAIHGDSVAIPEIKRLYVDGDGPAASAACLALERLATPEAVAALAELARQPATAARRVALVDALTGIGTARCVGPLLELLRDHRPCAVPSRAEQLLERFAPLAVEHGFIERPPSQPTSQRAAETVAERAAAALTHITGLSAPFASDLSEEQREEAVRLWREWAATHGAAP